HRRIDQILLQQQVEEHDFGQSANVQQQTFAPFYAGCGLAVCPVQAEPATADLARHRQRQQRQQMQPGVVLQHAAKLHLEYPAGEDQRNRQMILQALPQRAGQRQTERLAQQRQAKHVEDAEDQRIEPEQVQGGHQHEERQAVAQRLTQPEQTQRQRQGGSQQRPEQVLRLAAALRQGKQAPAGHVHQDRRMQQG